MHLKRALRVIITSPSSAWGSVPPAVPTVITRRGRTSWIICSMNRATGIVAFPAPVATPSWLRCSSDLTHSTDREPMRVG